MQSVLLFTALYATIPYEFRLYMQCADPDNAQAPDLFDRIREFLYEVRLSADFARSQLAGRELVGALGKEAVVALVSLGATLAQAISTAKVSAGNMQVIGQLETVFGVRACMYVCMYAVGGRHIAALQRASMPSCNASEYPARPPSF